MLSVHLHLWQAPRQHAEDRRPVTAPLPCATGAHLMGKPVPCATAAQLCSLTPSHGGLMRLAGFDAGGAALVPGCRGPLPACSLVPDCHQPICLPCRQPVWQRPHLLSQCAHTLVYMISCRVTAFNTHTLPGCLRPEQAAATAGRHPSCPAWGLSPPPRRQHHCLLVQILRQLAVTPLQASQQGQPLTSQAWPLPCCPSPAPACCGCLSA